MKLQKESVFVGELTTIGRRTGSPRTVELRFVHLNGRFYATTSRVDTKHWCRNLIQNPAVTVKAGDERFSCGARRVTDETLRLRVLNLRDSPPLSDRVVFELTPED